MLGDIHSAFRAPAKQPVFSAAVIVTFALGIAGLRFVVNKPEVTVC
jgi:hypothetical protein